MKYELKEILFCSHFTKVEWVVFIDKCTLMIRNGKDTFEKVFNKTHLVFEQGYSLIYVQQNKWNNNDKKYIQYYY